MNPKKILVVGGAGYIGSHMVLLLRQAGYIPVVLDNLSKGHRDAVSEDITFIKGDMADTAVLKDTFSTHEIAAVMHFASFIEVGESVREPIRYYENNVTATLNLLSAMLQYNVKKIVFSSTAAVYGEPKAKLINENHQIKPINPYGRSKAMVEDILRDVAKSDGLRFAILRYFNAAGADPDGRAGERHQPESHLIPLLLEVAAGERKNITVFGNHHQTIDGTCIRDYVHVMDICQAHLLALQQLQKDKTEMVYNLGTGHGYSVIQVIRAVERVTDKSIQKVLGSPRAGDPAILVADPASAKEELHWQPRYTDLDTIIQHAWEFKRQNQGALSNAG